MDGQRLRAELGLAMAGAGGPLAAADRLCTACVALLQVDGAAVSLVHAGSTRGTFGSSGPLSRHLDELQFTYGEGPCLDAVRAGGAVLAADLDDPGEQRWPAFRDAVLRSGVSAVFALPVAMASRQVGALDLFRRQPGGLTATALAGGLLAAQLAALPLLDLMSSDLDWLAAGDGRDDGDGWQQLASLERVEVYQATGMVAGALSIDPTEALVRLRAFAWARGMTASEAAWAIVERRVLLDGDDWRDGPDRPPGRSR